GGVCPVEPAVTVDPTSALPGETVTVSGEGFAPGTEASVQLTDAEGNPVGEPVTAPVGEDCTFETEFTIPEDTEPGDHEIGAEDPEGNEDTTPIEIVEPGAPSIAVDPSEVAPGESTTVTGEGFTPDATASVQLVNPAGEPVGEPVPAETDGDGGFTVDLPVPEGAEPGDFTVVGTDDESGESAEAPLTVTEGDGGPGPIDPSIEVDPSEVAPGESTEVTGEGLTPDSTATVELVDSEGNPVGEPISVETDENGGFVQDLPVPEGAEPGDYTVVATDDESG